MESIASGFGGVGCSSQRCIAVLIVGFGVAGLGDNKERSKLSEDSHNCWMRRQRCSGFEGVDSCCLYIHQ